MDEHNLHPYDTKVLPGAFVIESSVYEIGLMKAEHCWTG